MMYVYVDIMYLHGGGISPSTRPSTVVPMVRPLTPEEEVQLISYLTLTGLKRLPEGLPYACGGLIHWVPVEAAVLLRDQRGTQRIDPVALVLDTNQLELMVYRFEVNSVQHLHEMVERVVTECEPEWLRRRSGGN